MAAAARYPFVVMNRRLSWLGLLATLAGVGCSYRTRDVVVPSGLDARALRVDDVRVFDQSMGAVAVDEDARADARREAVRAAASAKNAQSLYDAHVGIVVRLVAARGLEDTMRVDGLAAVCWLFAPLGFDIGRADVEVDVTVTDGERARSGHGAATELGSLYAPARRKAIARALERALAAATESR